MMKKVRDDSFASYPIQSIKDQLNKFIHSLLNKFSEKAQVLLNNLRSSRRFFLGHTCRGIKDNTDRFYTFKFYTDDTVLRPMFAQVGFEKRIF